MSSPVDGRVPVMFAERPGFEGNPDAFRSPVIQVGIGFDPNARLDDESFFAHGTLLSARALIDTGADDFFVDLGLLARVGAPLIGSLKAGVRTVLGSSEPPLYRIHLAIPNTTMKAEVNVIGLPLADGTRAYEAIFGLRFLETGVLTLNPRGESYFQFAP